SGKPGIKHAEAGDSSWKRRMSTIQHTIQRAYKTELALNHEQITACRKHAGARAQAGSVSRHRHESLSDGSAPGAQRAQADCSALDVPGLQVRAPGGLRNLDAAFAHFFRRVKWKREGKLRGKVGYPQRKTRKRGLGSFRLTGSIVVFPHAIQLPRLG